MLERIFRKALQQYKGNSVKSTVRLEEIILLTPWLDKVLIIKNPHNSLETMVFTSIGYSIALLQLIMVTLKKILARHKIPTLPNFK